MPQDAFTIKYVAKELKEKLVGGKISRIIQPTRDDLTFIIYTRGGNLKLEACLSARFARLSIADTDTPVPLTAPNFCMLLRKHLQNAEILNVEQPDFERIIRIDLKCVSEFRVTEMSLYFELMGKYSNAVLCENGIIVGALKTTALSETSKRVLFGGVKYVPPEPQDKLMPDDVEGIKNAMLTPHSDGAKFISERVKGIAYATALDIVETYGEDFTAEDIREYVYDLPASPCVTYLNGAPNDFKVRSCSGDKKDYRSVLEAQAAYYGYATSKKAFDEKKARLYAALNGGLKKIDKRLAVIYDKLNECRDAETVKLKGELITANIYAVERGMSRFKAVNYYDENGGEIDIELDRNLTPSQNAQKYYKRYAKLKRTIASVTVQEKEALEQKDYLLGIGAHISAAERLLDFEEIEEELAALGLLRRTETRKKKSAPIPYRSYNYGGFKIIAGRNNVQNDRLTKGLAALDVWLHTQKYHSSHVGIITDGRTPPDDVIKVAAEICAYYSDGRDGSKIPVDYTLKKYVKKPPKANAGFVIYTDYQTALVEPEKHVELSEDDYEGK